MTLEDFFTLTEMKNGLTTTARVEELICVIQEQKNCALNNVGDAARQWSTAASILASTQNKECLDHFVQLNGLRFLCHWLQEAVECSSNVADGEQLISTLLGPLFKLPSDLEKLSASGLFATVEKLFGHKNLNIKEKAQILFKKWNSKSPNDNSCQEMEKGSSYPADNLKLCSDIVSFDVKPAFEQIVENSSCKTEDEVICKVESGGSQNLQVISCKDLQSVASDDDVNGSIPNESKPRCPSNENENHTLSQTATVSKACEEQTSVQEGSFIPPAGMTFTTTPASPEIQVKHDDPCSTIARDDVKAKWNMGEDSWEFQESFCVRSSPGLSVPSPSKNPTMIRSASCNLPLKMGKLLLSESEETKHRCASVDRGRLEYSKTVGELKTGRYVAIDGLDLSSKGSPLRKEDTESTSEDELSNEPTLKACEEVYKFSYDDPSKTSKVQMSMEMEKRSDSGLESGELDALEVARQVAIEVEREVVDYREELCSSSPEVSSREAVNAASPVIEEDKLDHPTLGETNGHNKSFPISGADDQMFSEVTSDPAKQEQILDSPNGALVQDSRGKSEKKIWDFDLNKDAYSEDNDSTVNLIHPNSPVNLSVPIAVSASKVAPELLIARLHFDGVLGWKGSAATSAFRPASPRRAMDGEKTQSGSKHKANLIGLDLNVAESGYNLLVDPASVKEVPVSSSMLSRDSSVEVSSLRTERIKLDLNCVEEEEAIPFQSSLLKYHFQNGNLSSSPASSSSSRQPSLRNFDLNDNPCLFDAVSPNMNMSNLSSRHGVKVDDPIITLMGSRMTAERIVHPNQAQQFYMKNEYSSDVVLATRPILACAHQVPPPCYGYNGSAAAAAFPFHPTLYGIGNIPHMVDSRGATVVPQILSSAGLNGAPLATAPYLMSITSTPSSSNGVVPSQPGLDLNFGMMQVENGTRELGNMKHSFMPGHTTLTEEQIKIASPQVTSGIPLKRKEPDSGWEPCNFGCKKVTSGH